MLEADLPGEQRLLFALAVLFGSLVVSGLLSWFSRRRLTALERAAAQQAVAGVRRANLALAVPLAALVVGVFELGLALLCIHALLVLGVVQHRLARLRLRLGYRVAQFAAVLVAYAGLAFFLVLVGDL